MLEWRNYQLLSSIFLFDLWLSHFYWIAYVFLKTSWYWNIEFCNCPMFGAGALRKCLFPWLLQTIFSISVF
ncbi:hypothetical protein RHMOL_Rhmol05G0093600 [Rhododendron molle]|uniref:Uncharacterized protein n=1 Tax=Rhododendron molle TaxID=49168 RepID=A0ACC0NLX1_RHOML|nr:hypothetical protein RHMOL_Rhmol05G0093600 [Rhododendron molle]